MTSCASIPSGRSQATGYLTVKLEKLLEMVVVPDALLSALALPKNPGREKVTDRGPGPESETVVSPSWITTVLVSGSASKTPSSPPRNPPRSSPISSSRRARTPGTPAKAAISGIASIDVSPEPSAHTGTLATPRAATIAKLAIDVARCFERHFIAAPPFRWRRRLSSTNRASRFLAKRDIDLYHDRRTGVNTRNWLRRDEPTLWMRYSQTTLTSGRARRSFPHDKVSTAAVTRHPA